MLTYRTYRYLIKPTSKQKEIINKTLEMCAFVFNKFISENGQEVYRFNKARDIMAKYKYENPMLESVDSSAIMNLLFILQDKKQGSTLKPKNGRMKSYTTSNLRGSQAIYFIDNNYINIPKLGNMKIVMHRKLPEASKIQKVNIIVDNVGDYFINISFYFERNTHNYLDLTNSIGLDYSSAHFYVDSNGNKCDMRHFYQEQENRIKKLKIALQGCKKNSKNYYKLKDKIGKIYRKTVNQRLDYLHKLSFELAEKYDVICVEELDLVEISKHYKLSKNTYENSFGKFLEFLKYKMEDRGKVLVKVDRYFPSSKKCSCCGYINNGLSLSDREWTCPKCKTLLNRDINAAINIKERGIQEFSSIGCLDKAYKIGSAPH